MENFDKLLSLAEKISEDDAVLFSHIPNIDLYVDQVTILLENYLSNYKRFDDDKIMTKTMINNYTKDKVLVPPMQKKYSREHIILLIMIYHLKQSLSINDIVKMLNTDLMQVGDIYEAFTEIQKSEKGDLAESLNKKYERITAGLNDNQGGDTRELLLILSLIIDANLKKQLAYKILDSAKWGKKIK